MTTDDLTRLPVPEKFGPWRSMPSETFITAGDVGRVRVRAVPGWGWKIDAEYCGTTFGCEAHTDADLPAAYRRALQAVGLASPWTSEVPTEPGVYVVGRGVKPYDGSIMFRRWDEDEGKMERPWVDAFGLPWTDEQMKGRRFFALDNLKETR